ncbi:MAG: hypothetical protein H7343_12395 [Undibacterium sp.]|nr:hypothetical protein [Opitutaceae bacterium]
MRFWFFLCCWTGSTLVAAVPAEVRQALQAFRTEGPKGWSFTQTTSAEGRQLVEHYDAGQPEFRRWTLITQDSQPPSALDTKNYREKFTRQSRGGDGPRLNQQIDLATLTTLADTPDQTTFTARLKTPENGDRTAAFLRAIFVWNKGSQTIKSFTIESIESFSPTLGVKIAEMRTTMTYSRPSADRPSLLENVTTRLRGRAFWLKSLDADMIVEYSDYKPAVAPHRPRNK